MKHHRSPLRLYLLLLALAAALAGDAAAAERLSLAGSLRGEDGHAVAGARVALVAPVRAWEELAAWWAGEALAPVASGASDAAGRFELDAPPGLWLLEVSAPGRALVRLPVALDEDERQLQPLPLAAAPELAVSVAGPDGRPLAGALVAAVAAGRRVPVASVVSRGRTGDDGTVRLPRHGKMDVELVAAAAGHAPARYVLAAGDTTASLRLVPGVERTVEVRDRRRRPIAGAVIATAEAALPLAVTGDDGRATVRLPAGGASRLTVLAAAGTAEATVEPPPSSADGPAPPVAIVLDPPVRFSGRVLAEPQRRPVAGARVWLVSRPELSARSGSGGVFSLELDTFAAAAPTQALTAAAPGYLDAWERLTPKADEAVVLLSPLAVVSGRVVDAAGAPVAGADLLAVPLDAWTPRQTFAVDEAVSDADGSFRLRRLAPETVYRLQVDHPGYASAELELASPPPGVARPAVRVVLDRGTTVHGLVLATDGRPVAGAEVRLRPAGGGPAPGSRPTPFGGRRTTGATTGADGRFEAGALPAGRYDLWVRARGYAPHKVPGVEVPEAPPDGAVDLGTVVIEPGARVSGRVTDDEGQPIAGAEVRAFSRDDLFLGSRWGPEPGTPVTATDADGRFTVVDLPAGSLVDLTVRAPGFVERTVPGLRVPPDDPLDVVLERSATVAGRVVGRFGAGLADAVVQAVPDEAGRARPRFDSRPAFDHTDEDGRFELRDVSPGAVLLRARALDHQEGEPLPLTLAPGERRDGVRIELVPGGTLTGQVTGPDGVPVPDAVVSRLEGGRSSGISRTDGDGRYRLSGLPAGALQVRADHPRFVAQTREVTLGEGETRLDFQLAAGFSVSGRVVDESGAPVAGASVRLDSLHEFRPPDITHADGAFELVGVAPGVYRLSAQKPGLVAPEPAAEIEVRGRLSGIELRLVPGAAIVGQVRGVSGEEVARLRVMATPEGGAAPGPSPQAMVDYEGSYRFEGLAPGTWRVMAILGDGEGTAAGRVEIAPGDREVRLDLEIEGDFALSGRVTLGGEPLAGAVVELGGEDVTSFSRTTTGPDGGFRMRRLVAGHYRLTVFDDLEGVDHERRIELAGDREVLIELAVGEVSGRVVDAATGAPVAGAEVRLSARREQRWGSGPRGRSEEPDGGFRLDRVPAGDYLLEVSRDGYAAARRELAVPPAGALTGLEVALEPTAGVELVVSAAGGLPPARVMVAALPFDAPPPPAEATMVGAVAAGGLLPVGAGGRARFDALPPGRWRVLVAAPGAAVTTVEVTAPGPPVPVTLAPGGTVSIVVPALAGSPGGARARLIGADGLPLLVPDWRGALAAGWPLSFGRLRLEHVPAGAWTVEVIAGDGSRWSAPVATTGGGEVEVRLE